MLAAGRPAYTASCRSVLFEIARFQAAGETGANVHAELFPSPERPDGSQSKKSSRSIVEPRTLPYGAPGVSRDQILECGVEFGGCGDGAIHVGVAQDRRRFANPAARVSARAGSRKRNSAALKDRGLSRFDKCAVGRWSTLDPAMLRARISPWPSPTEWIHTVADDDQDRRLNRRENGLLVHLPDRRAATSVAGRMVASSTRRVRDTAGGFARRLSGVKKRPSRLSFTAAIHFEDTRRSSITRRSGKRGHIRQTLSRAPAHSPRSTGQSCRPSRRSAAAGQIDRCQAASASARASKSEHLDAVIAGGNIARAVPAGIVAEYRESRLAGRHCTSHWLWSQPRRVREDRHREVIGPVEAVILTEAAGFDEGHRLLHVLQQSQANVSATPR